MAVLDYEKTPANKNTGFWLGPTATGALGITDIAEPTADEINNTGGTSGMQSAAASTSWNDFAFGMQASETLNEPSMADASTAEEFGRYNFGGSVSFYLPAVWDDNSNQHSVIYDLTDIPGTGLDAAMRIDGETLNTVPAAAGDLMSTFRVETDGETNPFTAGESKRRTVSMLQKSEFAHLTVVGPHTITAIEPASFVASSKGRIRASVGARDYTNALDFTTSDAAVIQVYPGGFFTVTGTAADTATVTITDPDTLDTVDVAVTVT